MGFGSPARPSAQSPMAEINMIPLIDVMLVLLVIFLVTAPLLTHAVKLELPRASSAPSPAPPRAIQLSVDAGGIVHWNGEVLDRQGWRSRMDAAAGQVPQPEVHLRADGAVPYRQVALLLADASRAGLTRIGFLTLPEAK